MSTSSFPTSRPIYITPSSVCIASQALCRPPHRSIGNSTFQLLLEVSQSKPSSILSQQTIGTTTSTMEMAVDAYLGAQNCWTITQQRALSIRNALESSLCSSRTCAQRRRHTGSLMTTARTSDTSIVTHEILYSNFLD